MKTLIIIPAHNEGENLGTLLLEISEYCPFADVLLLDDGSTDQTAEIARNHGIQVLRFERSGIGKIMQSAYSYAATNGYEIAAQIDGDGQHDPRLLRELIQPIVDDTADCVIGSRYLKEAPDIAYKTPMLRRMGMRYSSVLLFLATGLHIHDTTSGFRAVNKRAIGFFKGNYPAGFPEAGALLALSLHGFRIQEVPTKMRTRTTGRSMYTFTRSLFYPLQILVGFIRIFARQIGAK